MKYIFIWIFILIVLFFVGIVIAKDYSDDEIYRLPTDVSEYEEPKDLPDDLSVIPADEKPDAEGFNNSIIPEVPDGKGGM